MPGGALATTKKLRKIVIFLSSMFPQSIFVAWNRMLTLPNPYPLCHFELRACKYRFDMENELLYIFQALIYSTHRFKKVHINCNFDKKADLKK